MEKGPRGVVCDLAARLDAESRDQRHANERECSDAEKGEDGIDAIEPVSEPL
jgi:hypothetical protein